MTGVGRLATVCGRRTPNIATFTGETILCLSSIDWDFNWQGHQEIMSRLADDGNRVLFVENTGVRAPTARDLPRLRQRVRNWWHDTGLGRSGRSALVVHAPLLLPFPYSRLALGLNRRILMRTIRSWLREARCPHPVVWTFLPTPLARSLICDVAPELTVYYCADDFPGSSQSARRVGPSEEALFGSADLVFVTTETLRQRAMRFRAEAYVFPFGVSFAEFEPVRWSKPPAPADVSGFPRPLVGFVGGVNQKMDQALVADVATRMPEASFVFIGPLEDDARALRQCRNVHLLGARSHQDVPGYLRTFDVAIIPYHRSGFTDHVYPAKLNEYLAMGLPVVATGLEQVHRFNARYGPVVRIADGARAFTAAIREAVVDSSPAEAARRVDVARGNSWEARVAEMFRLVAAELARRRQATAGRPGSKGP